MTLKLTKQQADQLTEAIEHRAERKRTTKTTAKGPYHTVCVLCSTEFHTRAAEDRHLNETGHPRYALVLTEVC